MVTEDIQTYMREINEAFMRHDIAYFGANVADDVRWTMVGGCGPFVGKAAFLAEVATMEEGADSELTVTNVIAHGQLAAVEGTMTIDEAGGARHYAFRDIFRLSGTGTGKIAEITFYMIGVSDGAA